MLQAELAAANKTEAFALEQQGKWTQRCFDLERELAEANKLRNAQYHSFQEWKTNYFKELAEEKRATEFLTTALAKSQQYVFDWKAKFEAAREILLSLSHLKNGLTSPKWVDAEIEAKMKETFERMHSGHDISKGDPHAG